MTTNYDIST